MKKAYVQIIIAAALWGVMGVFVRGLTALGFSQVQIGLLRVSVSALVLLFVLIKKDKHLFCVRVKDLWCFAGTGVVSLTIYNICYFTALQHVTMSVAAVLLYTAPAYVMIMSAFIFREKITVFRLGALALVFGGCVMVTGLVGGGAVSVSPLGIMYGLGAGVSYALYSIFGRFALNRGYHTYTITFYTFLFSTLGSIPIARADELIVRMTMTPMSFLYAGGLGIISCALPYLLYTKGLLRTDNSTASMLATLEPAVATLTGVLFFQEILRWFNVVGMLMLFSGIAILAYFSKPMQRSVKKAHKKTATIVRKTNSFDWSDIPVIPIDEHLETPKVGIEATAQICYDEEALYVRLAAKEKHIRAEYIEPLDMPCEDSCLEFFFCPMEGDNRYFNIEFNPNCCMYLGLGSCLQDLVRLFPAWGNVLCPQAKRLEDGWEITYQVPVSFVRRFFPEFQLESGKVIRANFYKCGDLTVQEHELCWNRLAEDEHDFHRPCDFGALVLE